MTTPTKKIAGANHSRYDSLETRLIVLCHSISRGFRVRRFAALLLNWHHRPALRLTIAAEYRKLRHTPGFAAAAWRLARCFGIPRAQDSGGPECVQLSRTVV